jgi:hypothetical protein
VFAYVDVDGLIDAVKQFPALDAQLILIERSGLLHPALDRVLYHADGDFRRLRAVGMPPHPVSYNEHRCVLARRVRRGAQPDCIFVLSPASSP